MKYIVGTTEFQIEGPTIVTLGKFNGRHGGHQKLLRTMMGLKAGTGYPTVIFTFGTAPEIAVTGQPQTVITTSLERHVNMEKVGIDCPVEYPFTDETRHMEPEAFVRDILAGCMHTREAVVGPNRSFGYKGAGSAALLLVVAHDLGYHPHVIEKEKDHRRDISSIYVRKELEKGNVGKANQLLGQPYAIHREVMHGNHIGGSPLGFSTASIPPPPIKHLPRYGIYVSHVLVDGVYCKSVTNIGEKPTVGGEYPAGVETYIFGLEGDTYGKNIEVQILTFDRPKQEFTSLEELRERIKGDKEFANAHYEKHSEILVGK